MIDLQERKLESEHLFKNSKEIYNLRTPENLPSFRDYYINKIVKKYKIMISKV